MACKCGGSPFKEYYLDSPLPTDEAWIPPPKEGESVSIFSVFDTPLNYQEGETVAAVLPNKAKSAALLFDKICGPLASNYEDPPRAVRLEPGLLSFATGPLEPGFFNKMLMQTVDRLAAKKIGATPIFETVKSFQQCIPSGHDPAIAAVLQHLKVVDDKQTEWQQVLEFRKDKAAKKKYRDLRLWLKTELAQKPPEVVSDVVAKNLEAYSWAIKKHGLKTLNGALTAVFDPKVLLGASATATAIYTGQWTAALASGLFTAVVTVGQVAIWLSNVLIDCRDVRQGPNSEIAYIYEARKKFSK